MTPEDMARARNVEGMFNRTDAEFKELRSVTLKKVKQEVAAAILDTASEVKKQLLKRAGDRGKEAMIRFDLIRGVGMKTSVQEAAAIKRISEGLNKVDDKMTENVIQARRTIRIDEHRDEVLAFEMERLRTLVPEFLQAEQTELLREAQKTIEHPEGLGRRDHKAYLRALEAADPEAFARQNKAADLYFAEHRKNLVALHEAGLISDSSFQHLDRVGDYSPRRFIQHIDPLRLAIRQGKLISVRDSGLKRLEEGSGRVMEKNWRLLLRQSIAITNSRIARNEAQKAAWAIATQEPDQDIFRVRRKGPLPAGLEEISVMIKGVEHKMEMPTELAEQWQGTDPAIREDVATMIGWLSGSRILKPMATGLNPEFALTNFPRDIVHVWLTTHEYSPNPFLFAKQMRADLEATAEGAIFRTGWYQDAINEGIGMDFLTLQGQSPKLTGKWADIQKVAGFMGETSELWVRGAVRHRAIINGKPSYEATWVARNYLDFAQGGWAIKALDTGIPYLNARIQATRGLGRALKEAPGETLMKLATLGSISAGLYAANRVINKAAWDAVPFEQKVGNWIITTPFSFIDDEGNRRHFYIPIAKDQSQRIVATAFESMMAKMFGDEVDTDQLRAAFSDAIPILPTETLPPTFNAMVGYLANTDFHRNRDIWRNVQLKDPREEWTRFTHPALKEFGSLTNLSPDRTKFVLEQFFTYGNIYTAIVGAGTEQLMRLAGEDVRDKTTLDMLTNIPGLRRVLKATDPFEPHRKNIEEIRLADQQERFIQQRELDGMADKFFRAKKQGKDVRKQEDDIRRFIAGQRPDMQDSLFERFKFFGQVFEIPDRRFWLSLRALSPEARALAFHTRWMQTEPKDRQALKEQAAKIPGLISKRFNTQWGKLIRNDKNFKLLPKNTIEDFTRVPPKKKR